MAGIVDDILESVDDILGIRDDIGAVKKPVHFVKRVWDGQKPGVGSATDTLTQMLPSPWVVEYKLTPRTKEAGRIEAGDVALKTISKQSYPTKDLLDGTSNAGNVENLYDVGGKLYRVIDCVEDYVTWYVLLRPMSQQKRY